MGLYLEKIEENEKKIKKLKASIETSKAKLKKLVDENAHLIILRSRQNTTAKVVSCWKFSQENVSSRQS